MQAGDTSPIPYKLPPPPAPAPISSCVASGKSRGTKIHWPRDRQTDRRGEGRQDSLSGCPSVHRKQMPCENHFQG